MTHLRKTKTNVSLFFITAYLLFVVLPAASGCDKSPKGTISVSVIDFQQTPVQEANITVTSRLLSLEIKKTTSSEGKCVFPSLPPGSDYVVTFEKEGFITKTRKNVTVTDKKDKALREMLRVDIKKIPGRWRIARNRSKTGKLSSKQKEAMRKLETLSYLSGHKTAPKAKNVTIYNKKKAFKGLNLYCSGHGPEAILTDMNGKQLHRWRYHITGIWEKKYNPLSPHHLFWRRVHLMENGDLLAIFEGHGLIKIDKNSRLLWDYPGNAHHDLFVMPEGKIYVLTRKAVLDTRYNETEPILKDFIVILSPRGKEIRRVSVLKCLENSTYAPVLEKMKKTGDILHTNTIEVLKGRLAHRSPAFKKGNVLISILYLDLIAVVDMEKESVVWAMSGMWKRQHQPTVLDNGNMLIFDNQFGSDPVVSRVLEFDPFTGKIRWEYRGSKDSPFYTGDCGSCQRLPNGNTLISETNSGRAFEVAPDKTIVWEFFNPKRAGKDRELIASLFELIRIEPGYFAEPLFYRSPGN